MNIFNERLSQLMSDRNLTQEDIARAVGKTRQGVGRWLNNDAVPDIITVGKLRNVPRTQNNPHGLLITNWRTLENKDLKSY